MIDFIDLFKPIHTNVIGFFAKLFTATWAIVLWVNHRQQARYVQTEPVKVYGKPQKLLGIYEIPLLNPWAFKCVGWVLIGSLVAVAVGILPRFFILVSLVCYFPYFSSIQSLAYIQRKTNLLPFVLLVLFVSPSLDTPLSISTSKWEFVLIQMGLVQMYLSAALRKLRFSGFRWADGATLQAYFAEHYLWSDNKIAFLLAQQRGLCQVFSVWALLFELSFGLILFVPSLTVFYVGCSIFFHLAIGWTMRIHYLIYLSPIYMIFWKNFDEYFTKFAYFLN